MARTVKAETKSVRDAKKFLADVPQECVFWSHDGRVLHNMQELADALTAMSDETFAYQCNLAKNDFGTWLRDIIGDKDLARNLEKTSSKTEAASAVSRRISTLRRRLI
ncbi:MAG: hypothetical protein HY662_00700 [Chloroflexi bacterium]|nr:hypothetical protein [Chloroflexota bacterium]